MSIKMPGKTYRLAYLQGWLSIITNVILFAIKYWAGAVTGSVAIVADAWHSLSDALTSIVVILGVKVSLLPADEEHPFGHGRAEQIGSAIIGTLLAVVAFNFILEAITRLRVREEVIYGSLAIIVTAGSILIKEALAQFAFWTGKKLDSKSLIADGWHHRSDALSSIIVLAGIFLGGQFWWMDGVLGIIVALMIFYITYKILRETFSSMLGEKPSEELLQKIRALSSRVTTIDLQTHHIHVHKYGHHTEITFHIKLPPNMPLEEVHQITTQARQLLKDELGMESTIYVDLVSP
ncbi:MAG: cation diffusion facilitator family transporter [Dethiobacteria bacterium]